MNSKIKLMIAMIVVDDVWANGELTKACRRLSEHIIVSGER